MSGPEVDKILGLNRLHDRRRVRGAKKVVVDGITFDSKVEASYYERLRLLKMGGKISDFEVHPSFVLLRSPLGDVNFEPDFNVRHLNGSYETVDVKGYKGGESEVFRLKCRLFAHFFGRGVVIATRSKEGDSERVFPRGAARTNRNSRKEPVS